MLSRGLLGCLHFFSFSFLYSVLQQWFPPFSPPGHLSVLLPQLFFSVCSLVLVGLSVQFSRSVVSDSASPWTTAHQLPESTQNMSIVGLWYTLFASSQSLPPFFFRDPELYSLSLFWILFLERCLFPLHLVVFLGFLSCPFIWDVTFCFFMVILF